METTAPRILLAGTNSGCGKTTLTCALLQALVNRGLSVGAFKCGPDYIDPMFHSQIIGAKSANLDSFFFPGNTLRYLLAKNSTGCDVSVLEGVMGYYDGLGLDSCRASTYEVAKETHTPVVLVVGAAGAALSVLAVIQGFLSFLPDNQIQGVILNRCSPMAYPVLAEAIRQRFGGQIRPLGYLPPMPQCALESRHLGLVTAHETQELKAVLTSLGNLGTRYLDLDGLLELAQSAGKLPACPKEELPSGSPVRIAVAQDRAFSFYYADNLELLERLGAELCFFSPMKDEAIPQGCQGLILGGGYPELYGAALADNHSMRDSIKKAVEAGMPTIAECGGFLYLQESLTGPDGRVYPMVKALPGRACMTKKLVRFGYLTLEAKEDSLLLAAGERIPAHEFHYSDSDCCGSGYLAQKPSGKCWECGVVNENLYAGYPHIHFGGNPQVARRFLNRCRRFGGM